MGGSTILRKYLDGVPLWRGANHVSVRQLADDFSRYLYLPRLTDPSVLAEAARSGVALLSWARETFAYAESFDEKSGRYAGLRAGQFVFITADSAGLLVKPEAALAQIEAASSPAAAPAPAGADTSATFRGATASPSPALAGNDTPPKTPQPPMPKRYYGSVELDPTRVGRDAGRIAEEVISHLAGVLGSKVKVTLEIEAHLPNGATEQIMRVVTENSKALKFGIWGFEEE